MKVQIDREEFSRALARVQAVVERRATLPILSNVLLQATPGQIKLAATDLEVGVISTHEARVDQDGSVTLAAKKLFEITRELEESELSLVLENDSHVELRCGSACFSLLSVSPDEYPAIPGPEGVHFVEIEGSLLAEMIDRTLFASSSDEARYNLNGVYMEAREDGKLCFVATDGHRLAKIEKSPQGAAQFLQQGIIVPRKGVAEMRKLCEETQGSVEIGLGDDGFLLIRRPGLLLTSRLIDGEFPGYEQVIPHDFKVRLVLDRQRLIHALRRVAVLVQERSRGFRFALSSGQLELSASNPDLGEAREQIPLEYTGGEFATGFNAQYALEALGAMISKEVLIELVDELAPAQLRPADDPDHLVIIMPMRL